MSWNNIVGRYGTAPSALTVDDNELPIRVIATRPGAAPHLIFDPYYQVDNRAVTVSAGSTSLGVERLPGSNLVRLSGTMLASAQPETLYLGIDDPAHYAATRLKTLLEARGVRVNGAVGVRHRAATPLDDPKRRAGVPAARFPRQEALARLTPPPLDDDIEVINKVSQNLHAELLLRRVGLVAGTGSIADGVAAVQAMMEKAGVSRTAWDISDGSGMSTYNRLAPRGVIKLLRWIAAQPWGARWRETLPIGGVDGTLSRRFKGTPLEGRLFAKTGSLNATNALSGYLTAKSGRILTFSTYANDVPEGVVATKAVDEALVLIAEAS